METGVPSEPAPTPDRTSRSLRALVHCLAVSMLILTGTVFVFIYRQVVSMRKSTAEMVEYLKRYSEVPEVIDRVRDGLHAYRKQDPNFTPIFVKYFGTNSPPASTSDGSQIAPINPDAAGSGDEP